MRILVKCPECRRRYDASKREIGSHFRCHCGQVLTVHQPRSHEANVVRCSSCGGPREQHAAACTFCGADFTLHERDLNTVCPECLARVSDQARFCPQCSVLLGGERIVGEDTRFICPACEGDRHLTQRKLGREQLGVLECDHCAGFWLSIDSFQRLRDRVIREAQYCDDLSRTLKPVTAGPQSGPFYRRCVDCRRRMVRRQYVRGCGIILDICRDHGIWFDADELRQTIQWLSAGGATSAFLHEMQARQRTSGSGAPPAPTAASEATSPSDARAGQKDIVVDLLDRLVAEIADLFR